MDLKPIIWKTMPPPTDPKVWPCMVPGCNKLATHRVIIRREPATLNLIVCLECGRRPDRMLWHLLEPQKIEAPIDRLIRRVCD